VDYEKFVRTWQQAKDVQEVSAAMGISSKSASSRARHLRTKGVELKKMTGGGGLRIDYGALADIAMEEATRPS
jgi:hypothetical protein